MSTKKKRKPAKNTRKRKRKLKRPGQIQTLHTLLAVLILIFVIAAGIFFGFSATEDGTYYVYDPAVSSRPVAEYRHLSFAQNKVGSLSEQAYALDADGQVVSIHSGLVLLNVRDLYTNTNYTQDETGEAGYLNGSYAEDAIFIRQDGEQVLAEISGVRAWFDLEDVELFPFTDGLTSSFYTVQDGNLIHTILLNMADGSSSSILISEAPDFLQEGLTYYSYDGNWFYTDLPDLQQDLLAGNHDQALNTQAWYSWEQYLPHYSTLDISAADADAYLEQILSNPEESVLYQNYALFEQVEQETGVNAAMMFALACNESSFGTSTYALENNNLFGHGALDSDPDQALVYETLYDCISAHALDFIDAGYANPEDYRYQGSWFGNKASGMNVYYASDPYWGEKAGAILYQLLSIAQGKAPQVITTRAEQPIPVYRSPDDPEEVYTVPEGAFFSGFILPDSETQNQLWYTFTGETSRLPKPWYVLVSDIKE